MNTSAMIGGMHTFSEKRQILKATNVIYNSGLYKKAAYNDFGKSRMRTNTMLAVQEFLMEDRSNPFKKAGLVLLAVGIIDVGVMAWAIASKVSYSSSFNIFAVVVGILLLRGSVRVARVVRWFSVFLVVGFSGVLVIVPLATPLDLVLAHLKVHTAQSLGSFVLGLAVIGMLIWVYRQLSTSESLELLSEAGYKTGKPTSAYIAGSVLLVLAAGLSIGALNGETARKAKDLAEGQLGPEYSYHVSSMSMSGSSGSAWVVAYNDDEIKNIQVQW
jgi:hypothetical protein